MQENAVHLEILKQCFPTKQPKEVLENKEPVIKVWTETINRNQLEHLVFSMPDAVDINFKRSGTGITVILTNKK